MPFLPAAFLPYALQPPRESSTPPDASTSPADALDLFDIDISSALTEPPERKSFAADRVDEAAPGASVTNAMDLEGIGGCRVIKRGLSEWEHNNDRPSFVSSPAAAPSETSGCLEILLLFSNLTCNLCWMVPGVVLSPPSRTALLGRRGRDGDRQQLCIPASASG